jgi:hypothetical protein
MAAHDSASASARIFLEHLHLAVSKVIIRVDPGLRRPFLPSTKSGRKGGKGETLMRYGYSGPERGIVTSLRASDVN